MVSLAEVDAEGWVGLSSSVDSDNSGTGDKSEYAFFLNRTVGGVTGESGLTGVRELKKIKKK